MKDLKEMMGQSDESGDSMKKDAKLKVLKQLRQMAADMVGGDVKDGLDSMKKVTVAAPDKAGLEDGLAKAKDMLAGHEMEETDDTAELPDDEMEAEESEEMSPEEMKAKIAELQAKLAAR